MTDIQPSPRRRLPEENARLACGKCRAHMDLLPYVPGLGTLTGRIFECSGCGHILIKPE
jgi:hypothetical protein